MNEQHKTKPEKSQTNINLEERVQEERTIIRPISHEYPAHIGTRYHKDMYPEECDGCGYTSEDME